LLKLVSGVIEATSGSIKVKGSSKTLLQIGTGFHRDFTGRENIKSYFALQGILNKEEINEYIEQILAFAELEDYIDQPLKTYSTGMAARLMFSTATVTSPEIMILDEVLSVGDAYFTEKCYQRITQLTEENNSTLLLVTHDVYSSSRICDRMIWIDQGAVIMDDVPDAALKAYEDSIRLQEESRLRKKSIAEINTNVSADDNDKKLLIVEFLTKNNTPLEDNVYFHSIKLNIDKNNSICLNVANPKNPTECGLIHENSLWGESLKWEDRNCRPMLNYGSPFHKVSCYFYVPSNFNLNNLISSLSIEVRTPENCDLTLKCLIGDRKCYSTNINIEDNQSWNKIQVNCSELEETSISTPNKSGVFGIGSIMISDVKITNSKNESTYRLKHGEEAKIHFYYKINDPNFNELVEITINIMKNEVISACRYFTKKIAFNAKKIPAGMITLELDKIRLGQGNYSLSIRLARSGYNDTKALKFYTICDDVLCLLRGVIDFSVIGGGNISYNTGYVADGNWIQNHELII